MLYLSVSVFFFRVALVGISIFCFTVVKKDALEKRKEHLRIKREIKQEIIDEIEISSKKQ